MAPHPTARFIPYGRQTIEDDDIAAVSAVLRSDWLTTGPKVAEFEEAIARFSGAGEAVAMSSGTAALHAAMYALGIGPGDEVIVPAMTFAASANCVVLQGGKPVFVDVDAETLLLDTAKVEAKITPRTKAIIAVDYAGQPCDYDTLRRITQRHGLALVADACHALGASYKGRSVGTLADLTVFSFHPVKHIATGEGGMVVTDNAAYAQRLRLFRNHGISTDHGQRAEKGTWHYDMVDLGLNYRLTDMQCALGLSQLGKLPRWLARRREIAARYDAAFATLAEVEPLRTALDQAHAYHLYVVQLRLERLKTDRDGIFSALRREGLGVNVHYTPVHLHPFYRERFGYAEGEFPAAEAAYIRIISLPMFHGLTNDDAAFVIAKVRKVIEAHRAD